MKMRLVMIALALGLLGVGSTGCVVRTRPAGHSHHGSTVKHSHRHCHERGHKGKVVCHTHPHKHPGHH
jgi:hypothetical protein